MVPVFAALLLANMAASQARQSAQPVVIPTPVSIQAPVVVRKVKPDYAPEARQARLQGTAVLRAEIGPDGSVRQVRVLQALGMGLDEKAVEAVRRWRFRPGLKKSQPVTAWAVVEVRFRLEHGSGKAVRR